MFKKFSVLNRPITPHLLVYSSQLSSLFSIWHRISGVTLVSLLTTFIVNVRVTSNFDFCSFFIISEALIIFSTFEWIFNYFFIFSLTILLYHSFNGIRHITWDLGFFLNFKYIFYSSIMLIFSLLLILILNLFIL